MESITALILDEGNWMPVSMGIALLVTGIFVYRIRNTNVNARARILRTMSLFFGVTIAMMGTGHLLAVTTKLLTSQVENPVWFLYLIGAALIVPSTWLALHSINAEFSEDRDRKPLILNSWLSLTLLILGIANLPLAIPGFLNIGYYLHSRRSVGWAILGLAILVNVGLFIGSLIFMTSGQSFEEFTGL